MTRRSRRMERRAPSPTTAAAARLAVVLAALLSGCGGEGGSASPTQPSAGTSGVQVPNEGWLHVPEGTPIAYRNNPPASGSHYPVWLRYELYTAPIARGYWVHNLEHGAVVLLHRPDAAGPGIDQLRAAYRALPADPACGHSRALLVPDPELDVPFAAVAADWVLEMQQVDAAAIRSFTLEHRAHAPEDVCDSGTRP